MQIRIVAAADIETYIAVDGDDRYYVLSLDDTQEIELGDVLSGQFDGSGSLSYSIQNLTQDQPVRICLESWDCAVEQAINTLLGFKRTGPITVFAGSKRFASQGNEIAGELRDEITKAGF